jgi:hypothetical protein
MIKRINYIILLVLLSFTAYAQSPAVVQFASSEHYFAGQDISLQFYADTPGKTRVNLDLPNGLALSYGQIVTLAGDFYGIPNSPISLGKTKAERISRFLAAYATLAEDIPAVKEATKIWDIIKDEQEQLREGVQQGLDPSEIFASFAQEHDIAWNCITGGLCPSDFPWLDKTTFSKIYYLKPGRYLILLDTDFDHFGKGAWLAYSAGHEAALAKAIEAHADKNLTKLAQAYAMNAFANHFFTDGFSSGHMRTPRTELYTQVSPPTVGSLLAGYMHNEDGNNGLIVTNANGDTWKAFGDGHYLDPRNQVNREILHKAMQISADEIFTAYLSGKLPTEDLALKYIPNNAKLDQNREDKTNPSPLFYWDSETHQVLRRIELNNPNNYQWTSSWIGWETLLEIAKNNNIRPPIQSFLLAHPDTSNEAIKRGLITDRELLYFFQSNKKQ